MQSTQEAAQAPSGYSPLSVLLRVGQAGAVAETRCFSLWFPFGGFPSFIPGSHLGSWSARCAQPRTSIGKALALIHMLTR